MMPDKRKRKNRRIRRLTGSLLGQNTDWLELTGFVMGDVHSDKTVHVTKGASLAGDVNAARVVVTGLVCGLVTGLEVIVEEGGQIWGDIYTVALTLAPRGKVHGWVTTLDEGTVDLLRSGELSTGDIPELAQGSLPADLMNKISEGGTDHVESQEVSAARLAIWRMLRAEVVTAMLARAEIEAMFEERLVEASKINEAQVVRSAQYQYEEAKDEIARLKRLLRKAATQVQLLRGRYLWAKANLDSAQARLMQYQEPDTHDEESLAQSEQGAPDTGSLVDSNAYHEELTQLRVALVEKEIEFNQSQEQVKKLAMRLKKIRQLAENRFRHLNEELERTKRQLANSGDEK